MEYSVVIDGEQVVYFVQHSARVKRLKLSVYRDGRIVVSVPKKRGFLYPKPEAFVESQIEWIRIQRARILSGGPVISLQNSTQSSRLHKQVAEKMFIQKVAHWASIMGCSYKEIRVRSMKTRWGSCSIYGVLTFNAKLIHVPEHVVDYVVVHELAHTREHNHGHHFWEIVSMILPDFKERQKDLKKFIL